MMRFRSILVLVSTLCFACGPTLAEPGRAGKTISPGAPARETRVFILTAGQTKVDLGRSFLIPGSDSVAIGGKPLRRGDDYRINTLRGSIVLVQPSSGGERLEATFARYPLPFAPVFTSRVASGGPSVQSEELPIRTPGGIKGRGVGEQYQLRLSGSKTVGFSVGSNKDLGIDQSLRITMVGSVAKDLEVNAFLTDDNLPIQPEGNTEELKHLDRVYVQVKSKHSEVQIGDFASELSWSQFSSFKRELRGMTAKVGVGDQAVFAGGGVAKGRFKTASFRGREGVQGPYEVLSAQRFNNIIILSGTETVYLDGRPCKRGAENDYTIDYNRGTVTFTERVVVTDDSEIVIDYQMGEDNYQRTTLAAGWTSPQFGKTVRMQTFFFQESDDSGRPLFGGLSSEDRSIIELAGDDPSRSLASGIEKVDAGTGDYVLVPADSLPEHFQFVETAGDYRLEFYEVGAGNGDYRTDGFSSRGIVKYAFVGAGKGSYLIGRPLPLPERSRLFAVGASAGRGPMYFDAEGDFSWRDKNLLSKLDDGDNGGQAMTFEGGLKGIAVPSASVSLSGEFSTLQDRFVSPDKTRASYFYRDWGLEGVPFSGREDIGAVRLAVKGEKTWNVEGSYSYLSRGVALTARKADARVGLGSADSRGLFARAFDSRSGADRERRFWQGSGAFAFWHLIPTLKLESERYRAVSAAVPDTGRYYREGVLSVAGRSIGSYRANLSLGRRETDYLTVAGADWYHARENDEVSLDGGYSKGGRILELLVTHRRSRDVPSGATEWYDLARVRGRDSWERAGLTADVSYRLSSGEERTRERAVIFVGENQGDFDKEGREVGQNRGDYMLLYLPGDAREPVHSVELSTQVSAGGGVRGIVGERGDGGWFAKLKREVSLDHFFSVLEKSRTDDLAGLYALKPSLLQRNDLTVYGITKLREECSLFNSSKVFKLRLIYSREDEEDNRSGSASVDVFARDVRARIESAPTGALAITWEAAAGLKERSAAASYEQNYRVETVSGAQTVNYRIDPSTKLSLELGLEKRSDGVSRAEQVSYMGTPSLTSSIGQRLNVSSFVRFTYTNVESGAGKPLFFLEQGLREDWSLMGQYRFTRNVSFGLNYTGRREKDYQGEVKTVHDFKMESRAYF